MADSYKGMNRRRFLALVSASMAGIAGCSQSNQTQTTTQELTTALTTRPGTTEEETTSEEAYDAERDIMVEMRDGVKLATSVYRPSGEDGPFPTLVSRTPYNKAEAEPVGGLGTALDSGYAVVQQDFRGRFNSEGQFQGFLQGEDGYDTVEWAAEQDWSNGSVGMYGASFGGMATWQAIKKQPPQPRSWRSPHLAN